MTEQQIRSQRVDPGTPKSRFEEVVDDPAQGLKILSPEAAEDSTGTHALAITASSPSSPASAVPLACVPRQESRAPITARAEGVAAREARQEHDNPVLLRPLLHLSLLLPVRAPVLTHAHPLSHIVVGFPPFTQRLLNLLRLAVVPVLLQPHNSSLPSISTMPSSSSTAQIVLSSSPSSGDAITSTNSQVSPTLSSLLPSLTVALQPSPSLSSGANDQRHLRLRVLIRNRNQSRVNSRTEQESSLPYTEQLHSTADDNDDNQSAPRTSFKCVQSSFAPRSTVYGVARALHWRLNGSSIN